MDETRRLLYVGITRARQSVVLMYSGNEMSRMIKEVDTDLFNRVSY